ncbi:SDR family oxidoreductase [Gordonia otitidis]|uniref:Oxidoreductase n=1 Tax=Gordonia otitidis (strain DSM 44809 / CCUG 52243 / JCM 12355 / NBRC 100426 / IFM 10032) TaxID=1108044 RepID=H5TPB9_GORO1|nr:SDR family NAD(P)-dependent oxidoreductase [Gordonia otitidis]UEA59466.1 SDR family NAD(P)-dependent oxidoreductase [Gordonia otitidis]GAB35327.1 putative oxidoreductase [Gordonia otitidis NBRC 100426]
MNISDNTIFIAGATSGIGLGLALRLHEAGNTVIIGGRRAALLDQVAAENPGIATVRIDTTDTDDVNRAAAEVIQRFPAVNVVVAMSGIMRPEDLTTPDFLATAELEVDTNIMGPLRLVAAFTDALTGKDGATFITVSSGLAFTPMVGTPTYSATKAAIHSLSESLRMQLSDKGIDVLELVPPAVQTDLMPGQAEAEWAMPLDEFLTEVMSLLPAADREILVERVKPLRFSEQSGQHDELVRQLAHLS